MIFLQEKQSDYPPDAKNASTKAADENSATKNDVAYLRQRLRGMGRESRHNVISRRDNLMLSPDQQPGTQNGIIKSVHEVLFLSFTMIKSLIAENSGRGFLVDFYDGYLLFYHRKWTRSQI